jgi:hypothetical protein
MLELAILPGLHGLLIAAISIAHYRTSHNRKFLAVELTSASLLVIACLVVGAFFLPRLQSPLLLFLGWWFATIAALPLNITAVINLIKAFRSKRNWGLNALDVLLNFLALLVYLVLALWLTWILLLMLIGSYR